MAVCVKSNSFYLKLSLFSNMKFFGCTQDVKDYDAAHTWKNASCAASKNTRDYKENERRCKLKNDRPHCTMVGKCFTNQKEKKNMCKFCYRFVELPFTVTKWLKNLSQWDE